jgi:Spy/CpxP family protein refolding chaperone
MNYSCASHKTVTIRLYTDIACRTSFTMGGKNMQKRIVVVALVALLTLGVGQGVLAFGRGGGRGGRTAMLGTQTASGLELTQEQQEQLSELRLQHLEQTQDLRLSREKLRVELQTLWSAEPLDAEAIAAKEAELAKVRVKMVEVRQELQKEAEGVLTEEQLDRIKIRSQSQMNRGGRRGGGMGMWQRGFCW